MKRFVWRLQKVLDIRAKEEQLRQTELFRLTEQLAERRSELLVRQQTLRNLMAAIGRDTSSRRLGDQELFIKYAAADNERIQRLKDDVRELGIQQQQKMAEVLAVRRSKEGLEKLRAEAKGEFIAEQEKIEQRELDDRTTIAFARRESQEV